MMFVSMAHMMGDQDKRRKQGVLDILGVSAATAFGLRLLSGSFKGNCCNIRRSSDNAQQDIGFDSQGNFNIGQFSAFIGGGSGFVTKWYDQSGQGDDASQSTAASQPTLTLALSPTGKPMAVFSGSQNVTTVAVVSYGGSFTAACVATRTGNTSATQNVIGAAGANPFLVGFNTANQSTINTTAGQITAAAADNSIHSIIGTLNGSVETLITDGSSSSSSLSAQSPGSSVVGIGLEPTFNHPLTGDVGEAILFSSSISAAQVALIYANQKAYWGTP